MPIEAELEGFLFTSALEPRKQRQLQLCILELYSGEWTQFDVSVEQLIADEALRSRGLFFKSLKIFWFYYFISSELEVKVDFLKIMREAIAHSKSDSDVSQIEKSTIESSLKGYAALVCASSNDYLEAVKYGLQAQSTSKVVQDSLLEHPAIQISKGIYYSMISNIPKMVRSLIPSIPEDASLEKGVALLVDVARSPSILAVDALVILHQIKALSERALIRLIESKIERFPKNGILVNIQRQISGKSVDASQFDDQFRELFK